MQYPAAVRIRADGPVVLANNNGNKNNVVSDVVYASSSFLFCFPVGMGREGLIRFFEQLGRHGRHLAGHALVHLPSDAPRAQKGLARYATRPAAASRQDERPSGGRRRGHGQVVGSALCSGRCHGTCKRVCDCCWRRRRRPLSVIARRQASAPGTSSDHCMTSRPITNTEYTRQYLKET